MSGLPGVGDAIPDIAMETPNGGQVKPSDFKGQRLVIFFYPKDNTPGCTSEAKDFTALKPEFDKAGVALLGYLMLSFHASFMNDFRRVFQHMELTASGNLRAALSAQGQDELADPADIIQLGGLGRQGRVGLGAGRQVQARAEGVAGPRQVTLPDGTILSQRLLKSSGNPAFDASVKEAVERASPLPVPSDVMLFRENFRVFSLNYNTEE